MQSKICTKCNIEKPTSEFHKQKLGKFGVRSVCIDCRKSSFVKNKEILKLDNKQQCTKCKCIKSLEEFHDLRTGKYGKSSHCKECVIQNSMNYYINNKEEISKKSKEYRDKNKENIKNNDRKRYIENREEILEKAKEYYKDNKEKVKQYQYKNREKIRKQSNLNFVNKYKTNIQFKLTNNLRVRINKVLKGKNKALSTMFLIGCEIDYLMYYLQEQFKDDMNWDNHGRGWNGKKEWHIDHKRPCASFDLSDPDQQRECFHYTNLQPLWAEENLKKADNYV